MTKVKNIFFLVIIITVISLFLSGCNEQGTHDMTTKDYNNAQDKPERSDKDPGQWPAVDNGPPPDAIGPKEQHSKDQDPAANNASMRKSTDEHETLLKKAEEYGRIPVIVRLRVDDTPPGVEVDQKDKEQAIARTREQVINRLQESSDATREEMAIKTFKITPAFAMQADKEEIKELLTYPEVENVTEDIPDSPGG